MLIPIRRRRPRRVAILHAAIAPEAGPDEQDALVQLETVAQGLGALGYSAIPVAMTLDLAAARVRLTAVKPAFVFNLVESLEGDGRLIHLAPSLLDSMGLAYTGADTSAMALTTRKPLAKKLLAASGIATPPWAVGAEAAAPAFAGPYIVKSEWEHASIGIDGDSVTGDRRRLGPLLRRRERHHGGDWFTERFIDGREFNLSLLADGAGGVEILPVAEMCFVGYPEGKPRIVDYAAKWHQGSFEFVNTVRRFDFPDGDRPLIRRLEETARACWTLFGLSGYARVDLRVDSEGNPWVLEVNVNPCLSPDAGFAAAVQRRGLEPSMILERIIGDLNAATRRPDIAPGTTHSIPAVG